jgi:PAS domain S-box-containing protein
VNDRLCEFFGYDRVELVGARVQDLGFWAIPSERERMLALLKIQGSVRDFETTLVRKGGVTRDALMTVETLELREGEEPLVLIMVIDVTERKAHELRIRESERYRALFDENPMHVGLTRALEIVTANEAAAAVWLRRPSSRL